MFLWSLPFFVFVKSSFCLINCVQFAAAVECSFADQCCPSIYFHKINIYVFYEYFSAKMTQTDHPKASSSSVPLNNYSTSPLNNNYSTIKRRLHERKRNNRLFASVATVVVFTVAYLTGGFQGFYISNKLKK